MQSNSNLSVNERVIELLDNLGIAVAHFGASLLQDWGEIAAKSPDRVASITLLCPMDIAPEPLRSFGSRVHLLTGDQGGGAEKTIAVARSLDTPTLTMLSGHQNTPWFDVAAEERDQVLQTMTDFFASISSDDPPPLENVSEVQGEVAEITYKIRGSGPPLVLFPVGMAASQWEPLMPSLSEQFTVITVGGPQLGATAILESRGRSHGYADMLDRLTENLELRPNQRVLDVGCGTGVVGRRIALRSAGNVTVTGVDLSPFLLEQARQYASQAGISSSAQYEHGDAESLPFKDNTFDAVVSCTVMEEGDATAMLGELIRVAKPGGRVAVIVRAMDMPWWINLPVESELTAKINAVRGGSAGAGCDDSSLYERFNSSGLSNNVHYPYLAILQNQVAEYYLERTYLSLSNAEQSGWEAARERAETAGTFFIAQPFHCAVGVKA